MRTTLSCVQVAGRDLVRRYVAGRLDASEEEAFEDHYLTCAACQEEIRLAAAVRQGLAPPRTARRLGRGRLRGWGIAAAAALAALLLVPRERVPEEIARLGGVAQAPVYLGVPVRTLDDPGAARFRDAMDHYVAGRYAEAAAGLAAALEAGVDRPPAEFFRAASLLMLGRDEAAAEGFGRVIDLGATPYLAEARLYRAKALLRGGAAAAALAELERAAARNGVAAEHSSALADSIRALDAAHH